MKSIEKVLSIARQEIGYLEKRSNSQLDSKTANAGSNNYTKYARDLYPSLQGQPWCDMFVDWCMVQAFGQVTARQLLGGGFSAYTPTSAQYYKNKGQYHKDNPQPGDQIFFKNSKRICHTGLSNKWSEESRTRKAAQGKTANLALGTPAAQKSPKSGKFLTNINAKDWHLISPDGKEYLFHSLNYWLRENGDKLFGCVPDSKEFKNVSTGLSGAKRAMLGRNYGCCTYKGWKVIPTEHDIK